MLDHARLNHRPQRNDELLVRFGAKCTGDHHVLPQLQRKSGEDKQDNAHKEGLQEAHEEVSVTSLANALTGPVEHGLAHCPDGGGTRISIGWNFVEFSVWQADAPSQ